MRIRRYRQHHYTYSSYYHKIKPKYRKSLKYIINKSQKTFTCYILNVINYAQPSIIYTKMEDGDQKMKAFTIFLRFQVIQNLFTNFLQMIQKIYSFLMMREICYSDLLSAIFLHILDCKVNYCLWFLNDILWFFGNLLQ